MNKQDISFSSIKKLAIPALISGVAEPLLSLTDLAIVGNISEFSTESIAAIGIVGGFLSMLIWVFGQIRSGISSIISQHLGANTLNKVSNLPAQAIVIVLITSLSILLITYPFAQQIFEFYNASGIILKLCVSYYKIRLFGFPFTLFVIAVFGVFRGLQNTLYPMLIAIFGTVVNIVLDIILVHGITGVISPLGLEGAAIASVVAQISMALTAAYLLWSKTSIPLKFTLPFNKEIPRFIVMVLNLFIRTLALNIALYFATSFATSYGKNYIAAFTIGLNIWLTCAFMIDGIASAGNIISGKLFGAKKYKLLVQLGKKLIIYGFLFGLFLSIIGFIFYDYIGILFTNDQAVLSDFKTSFWLVLIMQPICAIAFIYDGIFKGMGQMKYLRNILLIATGIVFIPTLLIFDYYDFKLYAIWNAFFLWMITRGGLLILKFREKFIVLAKKS